MYFNLKNCTLTFKANFPLRTLDYKGAQPPYRADKRPKGALSARPIYKENKVITLNTISSHTVGDIDVKPSRGDRPRSNLGCKGCDQLPGVTSCQL